MAQLVARFHGMEEVRGSNPLSSTQAVTDQVAAFVVPTWRRCASGVRGLAARVRRTTN
jgi:hypothetical protein